MSAFSEDPATAQRNALRGNADRVKVSGQVLEFEFDELPETGELCFPRLRSRLKSAAWKSAEKSELALTPDLEEWRVRLENPPNTSPLTVRVEFLDAPILGTHRIVTTLDQSQASFVLPAHFAEITGEKLRYEPQPHKNTIGYWTMPMDWAAWHLKVDVSGNYAVDIYQGCGTGQGGSDVDVVLVQDNQIIGRISFQVEDTEHFQNFKRRRIGTFEIAETGNYDIQIHAKNVAKNAVMDVRQLKLTRTND